MDAFSQGTVQLPKGLDLAAIFRNPKQQQMSTAGTLPTSQVGQLPDLGSAPQGTASTYSQSPAGQLPPLMAGGAPAGAPMENPYVKMMESLWGGAGGSRIGSTKKMPWLELMKYR